MGVMGCIHSINGICKYAPTRNPCIFEYEPDPEIKCKSYKPKDE